MEADLARPSKSLTVSARDLLFGSVALNLILLMWIVLVLGAVAIFAVVATFFEHHLRGLTLFAIAVGGAAIVSQLAQFCAWSAKGFTEVRPIRIGVTGLVFLAYGVSAIKSGVIDGYVAIGVTIVTGMAIAWTYWRKLSAVPKDRPR